MRLGVTPGSGEGFLAGDAVNTASRLQSVAPEMGVAVGQATYEATAPVFDYQELEPASLKGKSEPVRVFHALRPRARLGTDLTRTHDTPFVGREIDLALLKGIFDKTVAAATVQLVTVVGEPGLGKSRIVGELATYIDTRPDLITWRQGRCMPYGEGITFWALGEIVKAHAGILESDAPDVAQRKLDAVLPDGSEQAWFRQRLLPLLGIEATSSAEREELFTAWRRFLEQIAEDGPTVLVFEDLHWADDAMLDFLEHLADRAEGVPLLVVGTARPELFERRPDYGRLRNATPINLSPLTEDETARLVAALLRAAVIPADLQQQILERAGGNPLFAEEFVRLLKDRGLLVERGSSWELREGAEVPFPDSVQALIAARLDTLRPEAKSMLADAAVIGKVFWAGAVAAMGDRDPADVTETMRELSRKELVHPSRHSSIEGESEHVFWHILTRDVAYAQLPRGSRASRHVAAARWIESRAPEREEDLADILAYHYATALDLARAAGQTELAAEIEAPALRFLKLAGERALGLDTSAALANFERALALTPPGHPERPELLVRFGQAALDGSRSSEAADVLQEAISTFRERGDLRAAASAMFQLVGALQVLGDARSFELGAEALAILEPLPPGPELVDAMIEVARARTLGGEGAEGIDLAEQALSLAAELGLPTPVRALGYRGLARAGLGRREGLDDMREALRLAIERGDGRQAGLLYNNLARMLWMFDGPVAAVEVYRQGLAFDLARGMTGLALWIEAGIARLARRHRPAGRGAGGRHAGGGARRGDRRGASPGRRPVGARPDLLAARPGRERGGIPRRPGAHRAGDGGPRDRCAGSGSVRDRPRHTRPDRPGRRHHGRARHGAPSARAAQLRPVRPVARARRHLDGRSGPGRSARRGRRCDRPLPGACGRRDERVTDRDAWRSAGCSGGVRRRRAALGGIRGRRGAGLRAARAGAQSPRDGATRGGVAGPAGVPRHLRAARRRAGARRGRRAAVPSHRTQLVGRRPRSAGCDARHNLGLTNDTHDPVISGTATTVRSCHDPGVETDPEGPAREGRGS